jgi:MOSC domain-containing protein YiiM
MARISAISISRIHVKPRPAWSKAIWSHLAYFIASNPDCTILDHEMARVLEILTAESPRHEMKAATAVRAVPGKGLDGDRYFAGIGTFSPHPPKPDFEITLIESEKIESFASESGLTFTSLHARRNIVTEGVDLNELVGKEFLIGEVRLRGVRLCEPCNYLAKTSFPETLSGLVHKAGLRAQIISEGLIRVSDLIRIAEK